MTGSKARGANRNAEVERLRRRAYNYAWRIQLKNWNETAKSLLGARTKPFDKLRVNRTTNWLLALSHAEELKVVRHVSEISDREPISNDWPRQIVTSASWRNRIRLI